MCFVRQKPLEVPALLYLQLYVTLRYSCSCQAQSVLLQLDSSGLDCSHIRDTHIDQLIYKLKEDRVRRVIQPMLANSDEADDSLIPVDDIQYVEDMGLIKRERGTNIRISNNIYREIIPRELTWSTQQMMTQKPQWYMNPDNSINMEKLMLDFQQFFRQNADSWIGKFDYAEAGPQLLLQAFLQRIVNGKEL